MTTYLGLRDLDNIISMERWTTNSWWIPCGVTCWPDDAPYTNSRMLLKTCQIVSEEAKTIRRSLDAYDRKMDDFDDAMDWKRKASLADLRYRALKGKPMKKSEVTQMMRNLVKNQWCAAHNGTITMKDVKAMNTQQLLEEYEYICRRLEKDRLLSAQYNLFRPKPAITEPPSKRQRVERVSSQPASVPAATTLPADDPDSAGGGSSNPAGSATPMAGSAASNTAGGAFGAPVTDSTVTTTAAMDSAGTRRKLGDSAGTAAAMVSPFADSAAGPSTFLSSIAGGPSPSNVSTDQIPIAVLFESTSGDLNEFFLESDEEEQMGKSNSSDGVVLCSKATDDEIVDHGFKGNGAESTLTYLKELLPKRTQDEWIVSSWKLYPKSSVHVLDLTNGKTVYMFVDKFYPIRATLLERMLCHRLTVPPSYCRDVVVAGNVIQTIQTGLRQAYECIASTPIACTARQMVFSSPWLTAKKESGSPLQTALVCNSNPLIALASPEQTATGKDMSNPLYGCDGLPKTVRVFQFTLDSRSEKLDWLIKSTYVAAKTGSCCSLMLLLHLILLFIEFMLFHLMLLFWMLLAAAPVSLACIIATFVAGLHVSAGVLPSVGSCSSVFINYCAEDFVSAATQSSCFAKLI
ncbi:hypothetical protein Tco_1092544 [Tanacetum coccineum]|uniref:Uncharacterized protein n=1 Tax=Tanacetum coccineum TaxID=301880 RepID=A0ABQ5IA91_9ASTR